MTLTFILQLLGALGAGGLLVAVTNAVATRRTVTSAAGKDDASAADIIEAAAGRQVERIEKRLDKLETENDRLREDNRELRREVEILKYNEQQSLDVLLAHAAWDWAATAKLAELGIDLGPVPPLTIDPSLRRHLHSNHPSHNDH